MSEVEVILKTWSKTDIPPNPSKNAHIVIWILIAFIGMTEIIDTPFVSSTIPDNIPVANVVGMFRTSNKGDRNLDKISKIPVLFNIDIITLKSITNPPIMTMVFTDVIILFCRILPRLLNLGGVFVLFFE